MNDQYPFILVHYIISDLIWYNKTAKQISNYANALGSVSYKNESAQKTELHFHYVFFFFLCF